MYFQVAQKFTSQDSCLKNAISRGTPLGPLRGPLGGGITFLTGLSNLEIPKEGKSRILPILSMLQVLQISEQMWCL